MKSLVAGGYHYFKNGDDREEFYDFGNDPLEEHDLSGTEEGQRVIKRLMRSLRTTLKVCT